MNLFDLSAIIRLDTSQYENSLKGLQSGIGAVSKVAGAALGMATDAAMDFAKASVSTGMDFDKAMSQVQATMLKTSEQMSEEMGTAVLKTSTGVKEFEGNLRDFAMFLGENTAFSATQAAEALNFMALAGYDTQQSMDMLPNVLNLAAAGNMDLARASDMVTDTQTAFGISAERTAQMVDEMAKAASTGNTNVEQLGDAFLVVGGLAQELNGGFVQLADGTKAPVDGIQEMEIALTAMANAGIKGSAAGTHMRNMIMKLSNPTSDGAELMEQLGIKVFDAQGKMRSLADIMGDLNGKLGTLTQEQKIQAIGTLFNARDLSSAEALLNAVGQDWNEIGESILNAEGAASDMAAIQLDNLEGDVTLFKSALEGVQILLSDKLTPNLREFVQFGTSALTKLSEAFKADGLSGVMTAFGEILSDGLGMIIDKIPGFVDAGFKILGAIGQGIISNIPKLLEASGQIVTNLMQGIQDNWSATSDTMDEVLGTLADYISEKAPEFARQGVDFIAGFVQGIVDAIPDAVTGFENVIIGINDYIFEQLPQFTEKGFEIITNLATGVIENLPTIIEAFGNIIANLISHILTYLPQFLEQGANFILNMVNGIGAHSGEIFNAITSVISNLISIIMTQLPAFLSKGIEIVMNLAQGILNNLPELLSAGTQSAIQLLAEIASHLPEFLAKGIELLGQVGAGLIQAIPDLIANIPTIISSIVDTFMSYDWLSIGVNIISGIGSGIVSAAGDLVNSAVSAVSSAWNAMTGWLGIKSPSRKAKRVIGRNWALGIGEGFEESFPEGSMTGVVESAMKDMQNALSTNPFDVPVTATVEGSSSRGNSKDINAALYELLAQYLPQLSADRNIYFNDGAWAGRLAPTINEELGRIAQWEAAQ